MEVKKLTSPVIINSGFKLFHVGKTFGKVSNFYRPQVGNSDVSPSASQVSLINNVQRVQVEQELAKSLKTIDSKIRFVYLCQLGSRP